MSSLSNLTDAAGGLVSPPPVPQETMMASFPARPRKVAPMHPGLVIAGILDERRVSLRTTAKAIGMSPTGLGKVLRGESPVTAETAWRIAAYFRPAKRLESANPELWLRMQASYDLWHAKQAIGEMVLTGIELLEERPEVAA